MQDTLPELPAMKMSVEWMAPKRKGGFCTRSSAVQANTTDVHFADIRQVIIRGMHVIKLHLRIHYQGNLM